MKCTAACFCCCLKNGILCILHLLTQSNYMNSDTFTCSLCCCCLIVRIGKRCRSLVCHQTFPIRKQNDIFFYGRTIHQHFHCPCHACPSVTVACILYSFSRFHYFLSVCIVQKCLSGADFCVICYKSNFIIRGQRIYKLCDTVNRITIWIIGFHTATYIE